MQHCRLCGGNSSADICEECEKANAYQMHMIEIRTLNVQRANLKAPISYLGNQDMIIILYLKGSDDTTLKMRLHEMFAKITDHDIESVYDVDDFISSAIYDGYRGFTEYTVLELVDVYLDIANGNIDRERVLKEVELKLCEKLLQGV
jgi:hypothetical protein